jgi:DNA-binding cell septation regulator SpoVG
MGDCERPKCERIREELEQVRRQDPKGLLRPEAVVDWAQAHRNSALHGEFEWSDAVAAREYRILQAQRVIRAVVVQVPDTRRTIRAYVSVPSDRAREGGYRDVASALVRARQELVNDALADLAAFGNRYSHLPELGPLFAEVVLLIERFRAARPPSAA